MAGRTSKAGVGLKTQSPDEVRVVRALDNNVINNQEENVVKKNTTVARDVTQATVQFHGQSLTVITGTGGERLVAMKPICEAIGLDWDGQRQRIKRHQVLSKGAVVITAPTPGGDQNHLCLPLEMLNGWLFGVDASRVKPEVRPALIQYQLECFGVLAAYWQQGEAINPRSSESMQPEHVERRPLRGRLVLVVSYGGRLWFGAANLCSALDIGSAGRFLRNLPVQHKRKLTQGNRELWLVDVEGARRVGDYCKAPVAEEFRPWLARLLDEFAPDQPQLPAVQLTPGDREAMARGLLVAARFMCWFDPQGRMTLKELDPDVAVLKQGEFAGYIADPAGMPAAALPDILAAVSSRIKGLH